MIGNSKPSMYLGTHREGRSGQERAGAGRICDRIREDIRFIYTEFNVMSK